MQAYDWAVESMKFVSSMNMDQCLSEEGVQNLCDNLQAFLRNHKIMETSVFDDIALKASNLGNKKLVDQCRIAKARCEETQKLIKYRETTIYKAREEIEARRAKKISLEQLAANTNISPLRTQTSSVSQDDAEDIWLPQSPPPKCPAKTVKDDKNNNGIKLNHSLTSLPDDTESKDSTLKSIKSSQSRDTLASSSQEDLLTGSQSDVEAAASKAQSVKSISPVDSSHQKEDTLVKRRSFAGFASSNSCTSLCNLNKGASNQHSTHASDRHSAELSEQDEGLAAFEDDRSNDSRYASSSVLEIIEEFGNLGHGKSSSLKRKDRRSLLRYIYIMLSLRKEVHKIVCMFRRWRYLTFDYVSRELLLKKYEKQIGVSIHYQKYFGKKAALWE